MPARVIGKARAVLRRSARHEVLAPNSSWRAPAILYGRNLSDEPGSEISRSSRRETPALRGDHLFDALQSRIGPYRASKASRSGPILCCSATAVLCTRLIKNSGRDSGTSFAQRFPMCTRDQAWMTLTTDAERKMRVDTFDGAGTQQIIKRCQTDHVILEM